MMIPLIVIKRLSLPVISFILFLITIILFFVNLGESNLVSLSLYGSVANDENLYDNVKSSNSTSSSSSTVLVALTNEAQRVSEGTVVSLGFIFCLALILNIINFLDFAMIPFLSSSPSSSGSVSSSPSARFFSTVGTVSHKWFYLFSIVMSGVCAFLILLSFVTMLSWSGGYDFTANTTSNAIYGRIITFWLFVLFSATSQLATNWFQFSDYFDEDSNNNNNNNENRNPSSSSFSSKYQSVKSLRLKMMKTNSRSPSNQIVSEKGDYDKDEELPEIFDAILLLANSTSTYSSKVWRLHFRLALLFSFSSFVFHIITFALLCDAYVKDHFVSDLVVKRTSVATNNQKVQRLSDGLIITLLIIVLLGAIVSLVNFLEFFLLRHTKNRKNIAIIDSLKKKLAQIFLNRFIGGTHALFNVPLVLRTLAAAVEAQNNNTNNDTSLVIAFWIFLGFCCCIFFSCTWYFVPSFLLGPLTRELNDHEGDMKLEEELADHFYPNNENDEERQEGSNNKDSNNKPKKADARDARQVLNKCREFKQREKDQEAEDAEQKKKYCPCCVGDSVNNNDQGGTHTQRVQQKEVEFMDPAFIAREHVVAPYFYDDNSGGHHDNNNNNRSKQHYASTSSEETREIFEDEDNNNNNSGDDDDAAERNRISNHITNSIAPQLEEVAFLYPDKTRHWIHCAKRIQRFKSCSPFIMWQRFEKFMTLIEYHRCGSNKALKKKLMASSRVPRLLGNFHPFAVMASIPSESKEALRESSFPSSENLLSAISFLSSSTDLVPLLFHIFNTTAFAQRNRRLKVKSGCYHMTFNFSGVWRHIFVDSFVPLQPPLQKEDIMIDDEEISRNDDDTKSKSLTKVRIPDDETANDSASSSCDCSCLKTALITSCSSCCNNNDDDEEKEVSSTERKEIVNSVRRRLLGPSCKLDHRDIYIPIIQKGLAKLSGSYSSASLDINSGGLDELHDLCGIPMERWAWPNLTRKISNNNDNNNKNQQQPQYVYEMSKVTRETILVSVFSQMEVTLHVKTEKGRRNDSAVQPCVVLTKRRGKKINNNKNSSSSKNNFSSSSSSSSSSSLVRVFACATAIKDTVKAEKFEQEVEHFSQERRRRVRIENELKWQAKHVDQIEMRHDGRHGHQQEDIYDETNNNTSSSRKTIITNTSSEDRNNDNNSYREKHSCSIPPVRPEELDREELMKDDDNNNNVNVNNDGVDDNNTSDLQSNSFVRVQNTNVYTASTPNVFLSAAAQQQQQDDDQTPNHSEKTHGPFSAQKKKKQTKNNKQNNNSKPSRSTLLQSSSSGNNNDNSLLLSIPIPPLNDINNDDKNSNADTEDFHMDGRINSNNKNNNCRKPSAAAVAADEDEDNSSSSQSSSSRSNLEDDGMMSRSQMSRSGFEGTTNTNNITMMETTQEMIAMSSNSLVVVNDNNTNSNKNNQLRPCYSYHQRYKNTNEPFDDDDDEERFRTQERRNEIARFLFNFSDKEQEEHAADEVMRFVLIVDDEDDDEGQQEQQNQQKHGEDSNEFDIRDRLVEKQTKLLSTIVDTDVMKEQDLRRLVQSFYERQALEHKNVYNNSDAEKKHLHENANYMKVNPGGILVPLRQPLPLQFVQNDKADDHHYSSLLSRRSDIQQNLTDKIKQHFFHNGLIASDDFSCVSFADAILLSKMKWLEWDVKTDDEGNNNNNNYLTETFSNLGCLYLPVHGLLKDYACLHPQFEIGRSRLIEEQVPFIQRQKELFLFDRLLPKLQKLPKLNKIKDLKNIQKYLQGSHGERQKDPETREKLLHALSTAALSRFSTVDEQLKFLSEPTFETIVRDYPQMSLIDDPLNYNETSSPSPLQENTFFFSRAVTDVRVPSRFLSGEGCAEWILNMSVKEPGRTSIYIGLHQQDARKDVACLLTHGRRMTKKNNDNSDHQNSNTNNISQQQTSSCWESSSKIPICGCAYQSMIISVFRVIITPHHQRNENDENSLHEQEESLKSSNDHNKTVSIYPVQQSSTGQFTSDRDLYLRVDLEKTLREQEENTEVHYLIVPRLQLSHEHSYVRRRKENNNNSKTTNQQQQQQQQEEINPQAREAREAMRRHHQARQQQQQQQQRISRNRQNRPSSSSASPHHSQRRSNNNNDTSEPTSSPSPTSRSSTKQEVKDEEQIKQQQSFFIKYKQWKEPFVETFETPTTKTTKKTYTFLYQQENNKDQNEDHAVIPGKLIHKEQIVITVEPKQVDFVFSLAAPKPSNLYIENVVKYETIGEIRKQQEAAEREQKRKECVTNLLHAMKIQKENEKIMFAELSKRKNQLQPTDDDASSPMSSPATFSTSKHTNNNNNIGKTSKDLWGQYLNITGGEHDRKKKNDDNDDDNNNSNPLFYRPRDSHESLFGKLLVPTQEFKNLVSRQCHAKPILELSREVLSLNRPMIQQQQQNQSQNNPSSQQNQNNNNNNNHHHHFRGSALPSQQEINSHLDISRFADVSIPQNILESAIRQFPVLSLPNHVRSNYCDLQKQSNTTHFFVKDVARDTVGALDVVTNDTNQKGKEEEFSNVPYAQVDATTRVVK